MARASNKSIQDRISDIEAKKTLLLTKIDGVKEKISELDDQIKELNDSQKQKDLENLLKVIKDSGKTPEEVIAALKAN